MIRKKIKINTEKQFIFLFKFSSLKERSHTPFFIFISNTHNVYTMGTTVLVIQIIYENRLYDILSHHIIKNISCLIP